MADIRSALRPPARKGTDEVIVVNDRADFHRSREHPHLVRDDGAWFDFRLTLREQEVISWSFEIRFPEPEPSWVRFDLNPPGHANDEAGRRCHLHPGTDDDGMAIPLRTPWEALEVLRFLVHDLRRTGRIRLTGP